MKAVMTRSASLPEDKEENALSTSVQRWRYPTQTFPPIAVHEVAVRSVTALPDFMMANRFENKWKDWNTQITMHTM